MRTVTNGDLDAIDLMIEPVISGTVSELDLKYLYARPGRFIPVNGLPDVPIDNHPFSTREGHTVWMSLESAHDKRVIGCARYQYLLFFRNMKGLRWTLSNKLRLLLQKFKQR